MFFKVKIDLFYKIFFLSYYIQNVESGNWVSTGGRGTGERTDNNKLYLEPVNQNGKLYYRIYKTDGIRCLARSSYANAFLTFASCPRDYNNMNVLWSMDVVQTEPTTQAVLKLGSLNSNGCLAEEISYFAKKDNTYLVFDRCDGSNAQKWSILK